MSNAYAVPRRICAGCQRPLDMDDVLALACPHCGGREYELHAYGRDSRYFSFGLVRILHAHQCPECTENQSFPVPDVDDGRKCG